MPMLSSNLKIVNIFVHPPTWQAASHKGIAPSRSLSIVLFNSHVVPGVSLASSWKPAQVLHLLEGTYISFHRSQISDSYLCFETYFKAQDVCGFSIVTGRLSYFKALVSTFSYQVLFVIAICLLQCGVCVCVLEALAHFHHFRYKSSKSFLNWWQTIVVTG